MRTWCQTVGTTLVVRPVIDLHQTLTTEAYRPTRRIEDHVRLRDPHCVAPHCTRPSRACDLDHIVAFDLGGPTSTDNLAPLCRRHHRAKTHGGWTCEMTGPAAYRWTLPGDDHYRVDHQGTHPLTE